MQELIKSLMDAILNIFKSILGDNNEIFNALEGFFAGLGKKDEPTT